MMIKSFTAESAAAALKQVRSEMGGEAVVLKTRHVTDGAGQKRIEVTACLDKPSAAKNSAASDKRTTANGSTPTENRRVTEPQWKPARRMTDNPVKSSESKPTDDTLAAMTERFAALEQKLDQLASARLDAVSATKERQPNPAIEKLRGHLAAVDVPDVFASVFLSTLEREYPDAESLTEQAQTLLADSLDDMIAPTLELQPGDVVVVMGSAGVGKTSVMGKLAAQLVTEEKKKVRLLSLDRSKVGAHDEIESYAAILGIDIAAGTDAEEMSSPDSVTLIDTSALPTATEAFANFARQLDLIKPSHRIAVFSSLTRSTDTLRQAKQLRVLNPTSFAVTKLDLTPSHGPIIAAADSLRARLSLVSDAPGGVGRAYRPDPVELARGLMQAEVSDE